MTKQGLEKIFENNKDLQKRIEILKLASNLNPGFKQPHIVGGFLRDLVLDNKPSDCDVIFEGNIKNQPGILECVIEAAKTLGYEPYNDWEFENFKTWDLSDNIIEDSIGFYSNHTDYLSQITYDTEKRVSIGSDRVLYCLENRLYDVRYDGILVWVGFRGRSYFRSLAGLCVRGLYLCHKLNLSTSEASTKLFKKFDELYEKLTNKEQEDVLEQWKRKTINLSNLEVTLSKYEIKKLK
jgi:hypothetical protein